MKNNIIKKRVNPALALGIIAVFTGLSVGQSDQRSLLNSNEINQTPSVGKIVVFRSGSWAGKPNFSISKSNSSDRMATPPQSDDRQSDAGE